MVSSPRSNFWVPVTEIFTIPHFYANTLLNLVVTLTIVDKQKVEIMG